jgi:hypothetical protein
MLQGAALANLKKFVIHLATLLSLLLIAGSASSRDLTVKDQELQPFLARVKRVVEAMDFLGSPFSPNDKTIITRATEDADGEKSISRIEAVLDKYCLFDLNINPESRVKVEQGQAEPELVEKGWSTFLIKVTNEAGVTAKLQAESPNSINDDYDNDTSKGRSKGELVNRWLDLDLFSKPLFRPQLSGLRIEYRIIYLYSRDRGKREATISFDVGQGTQDIGFRNEVNILFNCRSSVNVPVHVLDEDGRPTTAFFVFRDAHGHVYPSQARRLAPDFYFQPQVYRSDGESVRLPVGDYTVEFTRGPEYLTKRRVIIVSDKSQQKFIFRMQRWIDPARLGWYSGDHHIHAAGCMHYTDPRQGVFPKDMMRQIVGESLNVGSVLTWGSGYDFQKQFFQGEDNKLSTADNLMRYDLEISGFPSSHCGHLVLLRLMDQFYPGAKTFEEWPTWDLPILKWARHQGAVVGFAHSGWGLAVKSDKLPNYEMAPFDGIGANEYVVDVTHDAVDFISAVDTPPVWELNIWYHSLNAGFRTRISGETDFPCIYGERVGMGRSYVKLEKKLEFDTWVAGVRDGRSYVSDGKSHLMDFRVNGQLVGSEISLSKPEAVRVTAKVAARLDEQPNEMVRARRYDEKPYWDIERARIGDSRQVPVEVVVNGGVVARKNIVADGSLRELSFDVPINRSSWMALRILPSSHTNPIFILVDDKPIRASRRSAEWLLHAVDQCWSQKAGRISQPEREAAAQAYEHARQVYRRIIAESPD